MKTRLLLFLLVLSAFRVFPDEPGRHAFYVAVNDFFDFEGLDGFISYGYDLNGKDLLKIDIDFTYSFRTYEPSDMWEFLGEAHHYGLTVGWRRYFSQERLRPYIGLGARIGFDSEDDELDDGDLRVLVQTLSLSAVVPFGVELSIGKSLGLGMGAMFRFTRRNHWYFYYSETDLTHQDSDTETTYTFAADDYRLYVVFRL